MLVFARVYTHSNWYSNVYMHVLYSQHVHTYTAYVRTIFISFVELFCPGLSLNHRIHSCIHVNKVYTHRYVSRGYEVKGYEKKIVTIFSIKVVDFPTEMHLKRATTLQHNH